MSDVNDQYLFIQGPCGPLECLFENIDGTAKGVLIVCHPHPQHGGTMDNKVVHTLARTGQALGLATLRFNYRGVGKSAGEYDDGEGETDDLLAVFDWLDEHFPALPVWLAGFSFGAYVSMRASTLRPTAQLISVAPAVNLLRFEGLEMPRCPWVLAMGTADEIVPFNEVQAWVAGLEQPPEPLYFEGCGHFFHGRLTELRERLIEHLREAAEQL